jgi:hypothetical protein
VASQYPVLSVLPCSKAATDVETRVAGGFAGTPINLGVSESGDTSGISSATLADTSLSNPGDFKARKLPAGTQLAFTWIVRHAGKIVATHSLLTAPGTRTEKYTFAAKRPGSYTLTATITAVILQGVTATISQPARRTLKFHG